MASRGNLTTEKWIKLAKTSHDTALRDLELTEQRSLKQEKGGGSVMIWVKLQGILH
jgi:hypothetical protein